uniref:Uncharacterized protein n=2 Tax=Kalanchoe fedtschenkoi TaxID=63787 RepID=A0A7N0SZ75_KALFE
MDKDQEEMEDVRLAPGNLRQLLGVTVRSVQWSYAIFWSMSRTKQGVLEWGDGYYNGDIKTRKISQAMDVVKADKMGLERSKLLRELYELLLEGENCEEEQQAARPSNADLCPEDLSDAEWYYMVCMSFEFNLGQGLPGRALANGQTIWLRNAQYADGKLFTRSLLAKSASVQTVLCFPYLGGVMELGTTELVLEDPALIQRVKTSLLEFSKPGCNVNWTFGPYSTDSDEDPVCVDAKMNTLQNVQLGAENIKAEDEEMRLDGHSEDSDEELGAGLPDCSSDTSGGNHQSHVYSWHLTDGYFGADFLGFTNSSDCASQVVESPADTKISEPRFGSPNAQNCLQENKCIKPDAHDNGSSDDLHYRKVISTILRKSNQLTGSLGCSASGYACRSGFRAWKNRGAVTSRRLLDRQRILKKTLFTIPLMYSKGFIKPETEQIGKKACDKPNDDVSRILENERFSTLRSMIPSAGADKASVLEETIMQVQKLEARLGELESSVGNAREDPKWEPSRVPRDDTAEQVSDNSESERKILKQKRKVYECETASEVNSSLKVVIMEQEVSIEVTCRCREYLLLDIMDAVNRLKLDAHWVHSATHEGLFTLKLKSKFRGTGVVPSGRVVKQVIWESICEEV